MVFIDVRTPDEFATGHLQGALNIPADTIGDTIAAAVPDKNTKIILYCRSGARASNAEQTLTGLGYTDVTNIGGVDAWASAGIKADLVQ